MSCSHGDPGSGPAGDPEAGLSLGSAVPSGQQQGSASGSPSPALLLAPDPRATLWTLFRSLSFLKIKNQEWYGRFGLKRRKSAERCSCKKTAEEGDPEGCAQYGGSSSWGKGGQGAAREARAPSGWPACSSLLCSPGPRASAYYWPTPRAAQAPRSHWGPAFPTGWAADLGEGPGGPCRLHLTG